MGDSPILEKDIITAYVYGAVSLLIIPCQLILIKVIVSHNEFWNHASYRLIVRMLLVEFIQSAALVVSALFTLYPPLSHIVILRKSCSVILSTVFIFGFPLTNELAVYRMLVVTHKTHGKDLPHFLWILELICFALLTAISVPAFITESMTFDGVYWFYNKKANLYAFILDYVEIYICIPLSFLTYFFYLLLIVKLYLKKRNLRGSANVQKEWGLFFQSTFVTTFYVFSIAEWHFFDPTSSIYIQILTQVIWCTTFYWTSILLSIRNKFYGSKVPVTTITTVRSVQP